MGRNLGILPLALNLCFFLCWYLPSLIYSSALFCALWLSVLIKHSLLILSHIIGIYNNIWDIFGPRACLLCLLNMHTGSQGAYQRNAYNCKLKIPKKCWDNCFQLRVPWWICSRQFPSEHQYFPALDPIFVTQGTLHPGYARHFVRASPVKRCDGQKGYSHIHTFLYCDSPWIWWILSYCKY